MIESIGQSHRGSIGAYTTSAGTPVEIAVGPKHNFVPNGQVLSLDDLFSLQLSKGLWFAPKPKLTGDQMKVLNYLRRKQHEISPDLSQVGTVVAIVTFTDSIEKIAVGRKHEVKFEDYIFALNLVNKLLEDDLVKGDHEAELVIGFINDVKNFNIKYKDTSLKDFISSLLKDHSDIRRTEYQALARLRSLVIDGEDTSKNISREDYDLAKQLLFYNIRDEYISGSEWASDILDQVNKLESKVNANQASGKIIYVDHPQTNMYQLIVDIIDEIFRDDIENQLTQEQKQVALQIKKFITDSPRQTQLLVNASDFYAVERLVKETIQARYGMESSNSRGASSLLGVWASHIPNNFMV